MIFNKALRYTILKSYEDDKVKTLAIILNLDTKAGSLCVCVFLCMGEWAHLLIRSGGLWERLERYWHFWKHGTPSTEQHTHIYHGP